MDVLAVLTADGKEYLVDKSVAQGTLTFPKFRVGTGGYNYVPPESQSDLNTPIEIDFTDIVFTKISQKVYTIKCTLPQVAGFQDTISEVGVFTDTGKLFCYGVFDPVAKTNNNSGYMLLTVQFN